MLIKTKKSKKAIVEVPQAIDAGTKPLLVRVGNTYVDPTQVREIRGVKKGTLYIIRFKGDDNGAPYPCWAQPDEITTLLAYFNIIQK